MAYYAGIDIGSTTSKAVVINDDGEVESYSILRNSHNLSESGRKAFLTAVGKKGLSEKEICYIISTGYGRRTIDFQNEAEPEVICHAKGTIEDLPTCRTIIDIGGQDSKVIALDEKGIKKFQMNDKCAAGTGRYLDKLADGILKVDVGQLGDLSLKSDKMILLSTQCTIFAETEIISHLSHHESIENIAAGMHYSLAKRVVQMAKTANIRFTKDIVFSGGVARNAGMVKAIEDLLGEKVIVFKEPQLTAAFGVALMAKERFKND
ncbi:MAG: acyl-CoA dehydratase activase [Dissulfuribacterales bacterium]